jgi:hypothetical protein
MVPAQLLLLLLLLENAVQHKQRLQQQQRQQQQQLLQRGQLRLLPLSRTNRKCYLLIIALNRCLRSAEVQCVCSSELLIRVDV